MEQKKIGFIKPLTGSIDVLVNNLGTFLVRSFHYLALFVIGLQLYGRPLLNFLK